MHKDLTAWDATGLDLRFLRDIGQLLQHVAEENPENDLGCYMIGIGGMIADVARRIDQKISDHQRAGTVSPLPTAGKCLLREWGIIKDEPGGSQTQQVGE